MASVKRRIAQYNKQVGQPRGGLVNPRSMTEIRLGDGEPVDQESENLHPSLVGMAVDYLHRLAWAEPDTSAADSLVREVFSVALIGASRIAQALNNDSILRGIESELSKFTWRPIAEGRVAFNLDEAAVRATIRLVRFDGVGRGALEAWTPSTPEATQTTVDHVLLLVQRLRDFFDEYGPITAHGFTFAPMLSGVPVYLKSNPGGYTKLVHQGDGDILTTNDVWDIKVLSRGFNRDHTLQVLMYYLMGKESGLEMFDSVTGIGLVNPRLGIARQIEVSAIPDEVIRIVREDVIGYEL